MRKRKKAMLCFISTAVLAVTGCDTNSTTSVSTENTEVSTEPQEEKTLDELYENSIEDAMIAEEDEIEPVISIAQGSKDVIFNEKQDRVLMFTFNQYPDSYQEGSDVELDWGEVWVTSAEEMKNWYQENKDGVDDWTLRLEQLIGLPPVEETSYMTALWVNPEDMFRPAYNSDIASDTMVNCFDDSVDEEYKSWFDDNLIFSYYDDAYPWTRLGYTYDWADNGTDIGLCEFIVNKDSDVKVAFTKKVDSFIEWLDDFGDGEENQLNGWSIS